MTYEAGSQPRTLHQLIRVAAFTGILLMALRRLLYATVPSLLPSNAWPRESWVAGTVATVSFELLVFVLLLAVPYGLYSDQRHARYTSRRDLWIDCGTVVGLYLSALFLL